MLLFIASSNTQRIARTAGHWDLDVPMPPLHKVVPGARDPGWAGIETVIGHSNWQTDPTDLLAEQYSRILTAKRELNSLISEYAEYFIQTSKAILNTYNLSTEAKISLIDFTEKLLD
jgi:hypothetical protein